MLWVIAGRAAAITVLLGSVDPFFFLIGLTYALTVLYVLTLGWAERHPWLVDLQFAMDAVIVSALVQMTGGITSYFTSVYVLPIIAAGALQYVRGAITVSVLSALLFGAVVVAQYAGPYAPFAAWGSHEADLPPLRVALFTLGLNLFGFFSIAILGGYLAESAKKADARLKQASTRIADLEAFNANVIESLTSGLLTTDPVGRVISCNRAGLAIVGLPDSTALGSDARELLQIPAECRAAMDGGLPEGQVLRADYGYPRPDGRHIELGVAITVLTTPSGPAGYLLTFQDVTEARKREREARVQQRLAAVGEMAAGIAHEIRNPLASMSGSIQVLRDELPLSSEQAQLMDIVLRESDRLNDTIKNFLAYARPQRSTMQSLDLRRIIEETAVLLRNSPEYADRHQIQVEAPPHPVTFVGDEGQLRQIVWNLATNGLRAMSSGGTLTLSAGTEDAADGLMTIIRVRDHGIGIKGAFPRGSGLGLSIVHRIVSDYAGRVDVVPAPGGGTIVEVRFPGRVEVTSA
jgi:two-component system sensor histidine kinase PilS (NtrC family)